VKVVPHLRKAAAATKGSRKAELDEQIAAKRLEIETPDQHRREVERRKAELEVLLDEATRYDELAELAAVIEALNSKRPGTEDVATLCRLYVKRPWGKQYPWIENDTSYIRPLDATQHALIRDTLIRWGADALPTLQAFLKEDRTHLAAEMKRLYEEEQYWLPQRARLRGAPLARIAREREDLAIIRAELKDVALLIECAAAKKLNAKQVGDLCRVYTRRGWTEQNPWIFQRLQQEGAAAVSIVRKHVEQERQAAAELQQILEDQLGSATSGSKLLRHLQQKELRMNIDRGCRELLAVAP
jgi:hypothetical protein